MPSSHAPASPAATPAARAAPVSPWADLRSTLALAATPPHAEPAWFNLHAVLNLLNRLNGSTDAQLREDLVSRLADYLTALYRLQSGPEATLSGLCELTRSYGAMRYFMADAVEPWVDYPGHDLHLRSLQVTAVAAFLQQALDSLLQEYIRRIEVSIVRRGFGRVEIVLTIERAIDAGSQPLSGWTAAACGTRLSRRAGFVARVQSAPPA